MNIISHISEAIDDLNRYPIFCKDFRPPIQGYIPVEEAKTGYIILEKGKTFKTKPIEIGDTIVADQYNSIVNNYVNWSLYYTKSSQSLCTIPVATSIEDIFIAFKDSIFPLFLEWNSFHIARVRYYGNIAIKYDSQYGLVNTRSISASKILVVGDIVSAEESKKTLVNFLDKSTQKNKLFWNALAMNTSLYNETAFYEIYHNRVTWKKAKSIMESERQCFMKGNEKIETDVYDILTKDYVNNEFYNNKNKKVVKIPEYSEANLSKFVNRDIKKLPETSMIRFCKDPEFMKYRSITSDEFFSIKDHILENNFMLAEQVIESPNFPIEIFKELIAKIYDDVVNRSITDTTTPYSSINYIARLIRKIHYSNLNTFLEDPDIAKILGYMLRYDYPNKTLIYAILCNVNSIKDDTLCNILDNISDEFSIKFALDTVVDNTCPTNLIVDKYYKYLDLSKYAINGLCGDMLDDQILLKIDLKMAYFGYSQYKLFKGKLPASTKVLDNLYRIVDACNKELNGFIPALSNSAIDPDIANILIASPMVIYNNSNMFKIGNIFIPTVHNYHLPEGIACRDFDDVNIIKAVIKSFVDKSCIQTWFARGKLTIDRSKIINKIVNNEYYKFITTELGVNPIIFNETYINSDIIDDMHNKGILKIDDKIISKIILLKNHCPELDEIFYNYFKYKSDIKYLSYGTWKSLPKDLQEDFKELTVL